MLWIDVAVGLFIGALIGSGILLLDRRRIEAAAHAGSREPQLPAPAVTRVVPVPVPQVAATTIPQAIDGPPAGEDQTTEADGAPQEISAPHVARDVATGLQVLASLVLSDSAPLGDAEKAALRDLSAEVDKVDQHEGPVSSWGSTTRG